MKSLISSIILILSLTSLAQEIPRAGVVRIDIENPKKEKLEYIKLLPDILGMSFINIYHVDYIRLPYEIKEVANSYRKGERALSMSVKQEDLEQLTYLISGTFRDFGEEFSLSFRIGTKGRGASEPSVLKTIYGYWSEPLYAFQELNESIQIEIGKAESRKSHDIAVAVLGNRNNDDTLVDKTLISELIYDFLVDFIPERKIHMVPFDSCQEQFFKPFEPSMYDKLGVNVIFTSQFEKNENGDIQVFPILNIKEFEGEIALAPVILRYDVVYDYITPVQNQFNDLIEFIVNPDKTWNQSNIAQLMNAESESYNTLVEEAISDKEAGNLFLASHKLNKAIQAKPQKSEAYYELAKIRVSQDRLDEAISHAKLASQFQNQGSRANEINMYLGKLYLDNYQSEDALIRFKEIDDNEPNYFSAEHGDLNYYLGEALFQYSEYSQAITYLKKSLDRADDTDQETKYLIGMAYSYNLEYRNAIEYLSDVAQTEEYDYALADLSNAYYYLAYDKYSLNQFDSTAFYISKSINMGNLSYSNNILLLIALNHQKKFDESYMLIEDKILDDIFSDDHIYKTQGDELRYQYNRSDNDSEIAEESLKYFEKYLNKFPDDPEVLFNVGNILSSINKNTEAIGYYERALKLEYNISYYLDLAEAYIKLDMPDKVAPLFAQMEGQKMTLVEGSKNRLLQLYLECSALNVLGKSDRKKEKELRNSIAKGAKVDGWSYYSFEMWIETLEESDIKTYLSEITTLMKDNTLE